MINPGYQHPQAPNMGRDQQLLVTSTADLDAGLTGLWRIGKKMCLQALAWKLLQELEDSGVGTNEVENEAAKRKWNREVKKGMMQSFKEFSKRVDRRDQEYVGGLLKLRARQAREDWLEEKTRYRKMRSCLQESAKKCGLQNKYKTGIRKIIDDHRELYKRGRKKHQEKIEFLKRKYKVDIKKLEV